MASNAYNLKGFIVQMESWGLTDVLLPFVLIFVLIFAVLQKTKILGADAKRFNVIVSLVIGLLTVIPHVMGAYPANYDIVEIIGKALPQVSLIIVAIVMLMVLVGLMGAESNWFGGSLSGWVAIVAAIFIIWIFTGAAFGWGAWTAVQNFFGEDAVAIIVMLLVFGIIIWWVTRSDDKENAGGFLNNIGKSVSDMMSKK